MAGPTRVKEYHGEPWQQDAAYTEDASKAAEHGWTATNFERLPTFMRVTYSHVAPNEWAVTPSDFQPPQPTPPQQTQYVAPRWAAYQPARGSSVSQGFGFSAGCLLFGIVLIGGMLLACGMVLRH